MYLVLQLEQSQYLRSRGSDFSWSKQTLQVLELGKNPFTS